MERSSPYSLCLLGAAAWEPRSPRNPLPGAYSAMEPFLTAAKLASSRAGMV